MEIFTKEEIKEIELMQKKAEERRKQEAQQIQADPSSLPLMDKK